MTNETIIAAIDIGTNSTKATIGAIGSDGRLAIVDDMSEVTRLGEGVDASRALRDDAVARTIDAIARFTQRARDRGATAIAAAGTSALRDAANGPEFLRLVKERCGVDIEIVTGEREAELAFSAVSNDPDLALAGHAVLVFDIGGGSTELIVGGHGGIRRHASINVGAVRLTERFVNSDPPAEDEIDQVAGAARCALEEFGVPSEVVVAGIGGTALNAAAIAASAKSSSAVARESLHGCRVAASDIYLAERLCRSVPLAERRNLPGLEPARADVIISGITILQELLRAAGAAEFVLSIRGLRYGLLAELATRL
jgi:exopolyphosphatase/guanosine-5'-triphosphate,3'-diphosphate pyrophosphatase